MASRLGYIWRDVRLEMTGARKGKDYVDSELGDDSGLRIDSKVRRPYILEQRATLVKWLVICHQLGKVSSI